MPKEKNPVGRPPVLADGKGGKRRGVYLDDETWRKATILGDGKPSEGLRRAISACSDWNPRPAPRDK
jgi:hypothetical protein